MKRKAIIALVCALWMVVACACGKLPGLQNEKTPAPSGNSVSQGSSSSEESKPQETEKEDGYPVLEDTTAGISLAEASDDKIYVQYPSEGWAFDNTLAFTVYKAPDDQGRSVNINVMASTPWQGELTPDMVEPLKEQITATITEGMDIKVMEMRSFCDAPIIYMETNTVLTEAMLDLVIESGTITEAQIEQMGGREAVLTGMSNKQIQIYAVVDGYILVYTGTYYEDESKAEVITAMEAMIKNSKLL